MYTRYYYTRITKKVYIIYLYIYLTNKNTMFLTIDYKE